MAGGSSRRGDRGEENEGEEEEGVTAKDEKVLEKRGRVRSDEASRKGCEGCWFLSGNEVASS